MFGFNKKKRVAEGLNWKRTERKLAEHKIFDGYEVQTQKTFTSVNKRPDVFAIKTGDNKNRIVADAKCVKILNKIHIKQVIGYKKHPGYARTGIVGVAKDTHVPRDVLYFAREHNIKILRLDVSREQNFLERYILDD